MLVMYETLLRQQTKSFQFCTIWCKFREACNKMIKSQKREISLIFARNKKMRTSRFSFFGYIWMSYISVFEPLFQGGRSPTIPSILLGDVPPAKFFFKWSHFSKGSWPKKCLYLRCLMETLKYLGIFLNNEIWW